MRVLMVASRYLPHHGGLETVVREVSQQLVLRGHSVAIVTNRFPNRLAKQEQIDGIDVTRLQFLYPRLQYLKSKRTDLWLAGFLYFPYTLCQLFFLIRRFRPDVVNLHYLGSPAFFLWLLQPLLRFPLIVSLHGGDVDGEPHQSRFNRWLFHAVLRRAHRVTTCSRVLLEQALALEPQIASKSRVIHNGVDVDLFAHAKPFAHHRPYLTAVGQLEEHKGFDVLISAFARVSRDYPNLDLLIAGDGSQRIALEIQIQAANLNEHVKLLGAVDRAQVAALMCGSLVVVIPSRRDAFGIVGLEAMAAGKPIVATRVGGLIEALDGASVTWIAADDVHALADALESQLRAGTGIKKTRPAVRDWTMVADEYSRVLCEC